MLALWADIQEFYKRVPADGRFTSLSYDSLFGAGGSPKLKGKAAAMRGLVPYCQELSGRLLCPRQSEAADHLRALQEVGSGLFAFG